MTDDDIRRARELIPLLISYQEGTTNRAADTIAALLDERDVLARNAAYWKEEARRYCENADFWRSKFEVAAMQGASDES